MHNELEYVSRYPKNKRFGSKYYLILIFTLTITFIFLIFIEKKMKIKYFVLLIVFFFINLKDQIDNKISKFFSNTIDNAQIFYSFASVSNINIDIQNKYYNKNFEKNLTGFLKMKCKNGYPPN